MSHFLHVVGYAAAFGAALLFALEAFLDKNRRVQCGALLALALLFGADCHFWLIVGDLSHRDPSESAQLVIDAERRYARISLDSRAAYFVDLLCRSLGNPDLADSSRVLVASNLVQLSSFDWQEGKRNLVVALSNSFPLLTVFPNAEQVKFADGLRRKWSDLPVGAIHEHDVESFGLFLSAQLTLIKEIVQDSSTNQLKSELIRARALELSTTLSNAVLLHPKEIIKGWPTVPNVDHLSTLIDDLNKSSKFRYPGYLRILDWIAVMSAFVAAAYLGHKTASSYGAAFGYGLGALGIYFGCCAVYWLILLLPSNEGILALISERLRHEPGFARTAPKMLTCLLAVGLYSGCLCIVVWFSGVKKWWNAVTKVSDAVTKVSDAVTKASDAVTKASDAVTKPSAETKASDAIAKASDAVKQGLDTTRRFDESATRDNPWLRLEMTLWVATVFYLFYVYGFTGLGIWFAAFVLLRFARWVVVTH